MPSYKKQINDVVVDCTAEEIADIEARRANYKDFKLDAIRDIRLGKLQATDYLALNDNTLTDEMKEYRQGLRDIPQNNTTEEEYDLLLARVDGQLTHEVWSKP
jgi:hypothetical protein